MTSEVVAAGQGLTSTSVNLDAVRIQEKDLLSRYEQVKLDIQTQALKRRYQNANPPELWFWLVVLVVILG